MKGYDWTIKNRNNGKASVSWAGHEQPMYIGHLKAQLRRIIGALDSATESWGVPSNLDARGRARRK